MLDTTYYQPGAQAMEDGQFYAAAIMFQEASNAAKYEQNKKDFKKLYDLAMKRYTQFNKGTGGGGGSQGGGGKSNDEDAPKDIVPEPLIKDNKYVRTFNDLAGMDQEKAQITDSFITPLKFPETLKADRNLLLYGPPGTGKSFIVTALCCELWNSLGGPGKTTVNLFLLTGAEVKGKYVGETEKNLKHAFEQAQALAEETNGRTVIFMDEVDAIAGDRNSGDPTMTSSVNALLAILEGAGQGYKDVIYIAATNYPWMLDGAIVRRFNKKIMLDIPSTAAISELISLKVGGERIVQDTVSKTKMANRINGLALSLSWSSDGIAELRKNLEDMGFKGPKADAAFESFMLQGGHQAHSNTQFEPIFPLGVSFSDVDKGMDTGLNEVGMALLQQENPQLGCCPIQSKKCMSNDIPECVLTPDQRKTLTLKKSFVYKYWLYIKDSMQRFGSTVNSMDYAQVVYYRLTGNPPPMA